MYNAIYEYALNHGLSLPKYRKEKKIEGYIKLSSDGAYEGFEKIPKDEVKRVWCPHVEGANLCIICEKFEYVFPEDDANKTVQRKNENYVAITKEGAEFSETLRTISKFLERAVENTDFQNTVKNDIMNSGISKGYISFRIDSTNAENRTDWEEWFARYAEEHSTKAVQENMVISELSGKSVAPIIDKFPQNNAKAAGSGFPLYSNQHRKVSGESCSFVSYGCVNGVACPMSQDEADAINAGLKALLDSDIHNDKEFGYIYWYDRKDAIDLITQAKELRRRSSKKSIDDVEKDRAAQYHAVLKAVFNGVPIASLEDHGKYHMVEYNLPDKGRVSLSEEYFGTYRELYDALQQWYFDCTYTDTVWVNNKNCGEAEYTVGNICAVLFQCLQHKNGSDLQKEADIEYGPDKRNLLKAMLFGKKIPRTFLYRASKQMTRSIVCSEQFKSEKRSRRILLQTIKACLLREGYKDMNTKLNTKAQSVGYQCGRWFATMVRIQELSANGKSLNVTLAERYYRAAKQSPARTFTMVNDLKEHYLSKLSMGTKITMEKLFAEIASKIGESFPERFTVLEQGAFDLGYAQQRQAFFERVENNDNENQE